MQSEFKTEFKGNYGYFSEQFLIKKIGISEKRFQNTLKYMKDDGIIMGPYPEKNNQILYNLADTYNIIVSFNPNNPKKPILRQFIEEVMFG